MNLEMVCLLKVANMLDRRCLGVTTLRNKYVILIDAPFGHRLDILRQIRKRTDNIYLLSAQWPVKIYGHGEVLRWEDICPRNY